MARLVLLTALSLAVADSAEGRARPGRSEPGPGAATGQVESAPAAAPGGELAAAADPGLFEATSILPLTLEAPWRSLLRRRDDRPAAAGVLAYTDARGTRVALEARIKVRGKWRLENCTTPPLALELVADQIAPTVFAGATIVHLSTPCRAGQKYEQYLLQEYLIYKMYGVLTEASLRARLVEIDYRDSEGRKPPPAGLGLLVEDLGLAAERLGRRWLDEPSVDWQAIDPEAGALFALFQFLIGNTDWSTFQGPPGERCCHNAALLAPADSDRGLVQVPFDFDASGLVDTGEIPPSDTLPIRSARERYYRGLCAHNPQLERVLEVMRRSRAELEALWEDTPRLTPRTRSRTRSYLDDFYEIVNDPEKLEADVRSRCRG